MYIAIAIALAIALALAILLPQVVFLPHRLPLTQRYTGLSVNKATAVVGALSSTAYSHELRAIMLGEMVARAVKGIIRTQLRNYCKVAKGVSLHFKTGEVTGWEDGMGDGRIGELFTWLPCRITITIPNLTNLTILNVSIYITDPNLNYITTPNLIFIASPIFNLP